MTKKMSQLLKIKKMRLVKYKLTLTIDLWTKIMSKIADQYSLIYYSHELWRCKQYCSDVFSIF